MAAQKSKLVDLISKQIKDQQKLKQAIDTLNKIRAAYRVKG